MSLYTLLYKEGQKAAASGFIEASSLETAEKLGMAYCERSSNRRYISVKDAVLMKEEVFNPNLIKAVPVEMYPEGDIRLDGKGVPHKLGRN